MSDLIGIAASGVRGYRAALDAVGENVANASTTGYARRTVALVGVDPGNGGPFARPGVTGLGVDVAGLKRAHDGFLAADARGAQADNARLSAQTTWLGQIETTLAAGGQDIGAGLSAFYNAAKGLAAEPGSAVARGQFLSAADSVASRFRAAGASLVRTAAAITKEVATGVGTVNGLTTQIATLNAHLRRTQPDSASSASLADERDRVLDELARSVAIDVSEGDRGVVTVRLGDRFGATLVDGGGAAQLSASGDSVLVGRARADVSAQIGGGTLGGALAGARRLTTTEAALDGIANDFATTINAAHATGVDLAGAPGGALFATQTAIIAASPANIGAATVTASVADGGTLAPGGYALRYDGASAAWTLAHADGSNPVSGTGTLTLDGLTVGLAGAPADADNFTLSPAAGAAGLSIRITDPNKVAAADPWIAGPGLANAGTGTIAVTTDSSATGLPPGTAFRVHMIDVANFEVLDPASGSTLAAAQPYTAGASIVGAGFRFTLGGAPAAGDTFDISVSAGAGGDSGAVDRLIATRGAPVGTATLEDRWAATTNAVSTALSDVRSAANAATNALDTANAARDGVTGVSLDTEATDLVRFQQAYQASAKVIQTARDVFNQLLQIGG